MNGGYWGAVGVRGAVREKIKRQESLEKEDADLKKKVKTEFGNRRIKSPSIKVENILTRISDNSKPRHPSGSEEDSQNIVESILDDILLKVCKIKDDTDSQQRLNEGSSKNVLLPSKTLDQIGPSDTKSDVNFKTSGNDNDRSRTSTNVDTKSVNEDSVEENPNPLKRPAEDDLSSSSKRVKSIKDNKGIQGRSWVDFVTFQNPVETKNEEQSKCEESKFPSESQNDKELKTKLPCNKTEISKQCLENKSNDKEEIQESIKDVLDKTNNTLEYNFTEGSENMTNGNYDDSLSDTLDDQYDQDDNDPDDIWSSINEKFHDIKQIQLDISKTKRQNLENETPKPDLNKEEPISESLNSSFEDCELKDEMWDGGCELKDEITDEDNDIWACNDEIAKSISEKQSDVKAIQQKSDSQSIKGKRDELSSRKSRGVRKLSEETLGNPDSGKENADVDIDINKSEVHSPVSKRRKISNRRYFNDDFEDSNTPYRNPKRSSIDSVKSESNSHSSRGRSISTSTDEGSESELRKTVIDAERSMKYNKNPLYNNPKSKKIKIIDPSPVDPESVMEKMSKNKSKKESSRRESYDAKISVKERKTENCENSVKKVSKKPSKMYSIDIFDKEYEKARKPNSQKNKYP